MVVKTVDLRFLNSIIKNTRKAMRSTWKVFIHQGGTHIIFTPLIIQRRFATYLEGMVSMTIHILRKALRPSQPSF